MNALQIGEAAAAPMALGPLGLCAILCSRKVILVVGLRQRRQGLASRRQHDATDKDLGLPMVFHDHADLLHADPDACRNPRPMVQDHMDEVVDDPLNIWGQAFLLLRGGLLNVSMKSDAPTLTS